MERLAIPLTDKQQKFLATVPEKSRPMIGRAMAGTLTPRQAIKAKCLDCCNFDRQEAAACRVTYCPLWAVNPYRLRALRVGQPPAPVPDRSPSGESPTDLREAFP